jgi:proton-dependent oligopeptide transporter, POT family
MYTLESIQNFKGKYPKQLWYLCLIEMWERFTFYGMRALLALYISHLILSGDYKAATQEEQNSALMTYQTEQGETVDANHPMYITLTSAQNAKDEAEAIANKRYGMIQAFIYAMAFVGGLFADKLFGFRRSIFWGGILMAIGTFVMAVPGSFAFYLGVSILIVGNGFFKPNISTMVGALYKDGDPRRDAGFSLFYSGINVGALLSGLTIAYIGTSYSWSLGFGLAGVCMVIGLIIFVYTQKTLGPIGLQPLGKDQQPMPSGKTWLYQISTLALIPVFFLVIYYPVDVNMTWLLGQKADSTGILKDRIVELVDLVFVFAAIITLIYLFVQIRNSAKGATSKDEALKGDGLKENATNPISKEEKYNAPKIESRKLIAATILILFSVVFWSFFEQGGGSLNFFAINHVESHGLNMTSVNNSINSLWVVLLAPIIGLMWIWLAKRNSEPNTVVKFGLGFVLMGLGFLVFFMSKFFANAGAFTPFSLFCLAYLITTLGELFLSPIGLSMITKLSPKRLHGVMMGTWFLASAYGQYGAGLIGAAMAQGDSSVENASAIQKLSQYTHGYELIGYISIGAGILLVLISPLIKKLMYEVK